MKKGEGRGGRPPGKKKAAGRACVRSCGGGAACACVREESRVGESASVCVRGCLGAAAGGLGLGLLCVFIYPMRAYIFSVRAYIFSMGF